MPHRSSSSSAFPVISMEFTISSKIFCVCDWVFFNPTTDIVIFHLRGWCMPSVFLLLVFTHLGHECQDLLSPCMECMCAQIRPWFILSSESVFLGNGTRTHVNSKGKVPSTKDSDNGWNRDTASCRTPSSTHYWLSYSSPLPHRKNLQIKLATSPSPSTLTLGQPVAALTPWWPHLAG